MRPKYISASPTACPLRGYGRAGTQNNRLGEAVMLSTGTPLPAQWTCRRRCQCKVMVHIRLWQGWIEDDGGATVSMEVEEEEVTAT